MQLPDVIERDRFSQGFGLIKAINPLFLAAATAAVSLLLGCGTSGTPTAAPDVYVAGVESNGNLDVAKYWKNGVATALSDGTKPEGVTSIAVSGGDVYVAGNEYGHIPGDSSGLLLSSVAKYWKDGTPVALTDSQRNQSANAILVSDGDVYVAGTKFALPSLNSGSSVFSAGTNAAYWKNGVAVSLPDAGTGSAAGSISVSGGDIYVAGTSYETIQLAANSYLLYPTAVYWKNGVLVALTDGTHDSQANSIFVSKDDVYIAGAVSDKPVPADASIPNIGPNHATYWKNGNAIELASDGSSSATSIYVSGGDVYVAGRDLSAAGALAVYWKNGVESRLTTSGGASADQIVVLGSDVYVAGTVLAPETHSYHAVYWKNGKPTVLSNGPYHSRATSIALVLH